MKLIDLFEDKKTDLYVFAYGLLMDRKSVKRSIYSTISKKTFKKALLRGYERKWDAIDSKNNVTLNVSTSSGHFVNGVLIKLSKNELELLNTMEKYNNKEEVTTRIKPSGGAINGRVYVFSRKSQYTTKNKSNPKFKISKQYARYIREAVKALGSSFESEFHRRTTKSKLSKKL